MNGKLTLALETLAKGRAQAPSPTYDYLEGVVYLQQNDPSRAIRAFQEAIRQDSDHIRSLLALGRIYEEKGNLSEAAGYYQRILTAHAPDGWGCRDQARSGLDRMQQAQHGATR